MIKLTFATFAALLLTTSVLAQEQSEPDLEAEATERAYNNAQQAYLAALQPSDGWYSMEGGLRWRYVTYTGGTDKPSATDTVTAVSYTHLTLPTIYSV